jgi:chemotaxis protein methyltransferase CheR
VKISEREFRLLGEFIQRELGIKMPKTKRTMLEGRLQKRLRALGSESFREYCDYLFSPEGMKNELIHMFDMVTTNKTEFFREPGHFDYLTGTVLPMLRGEEGAGSRRPLRIWSAGCSTGEEPYTLAMVLSNYSEAVRRTPYLILASDVSSRVLDTASMAIYPEAKAAPIPMEFKKKYLLRSKDRSKSLVRIVPELRHNVQFRRINFMEDFGLRENMDIIFCRNVIIYFDRPTQEKLLSRFCQHLEPGGFVFMGHSETLNGLNVPLVPVAPTVYRMT